MTVRERTLLYCHQGNEWFYRWERTGSPSTSTNDHAERVKERITGYVS